MRKLEDLKTDILNNVIDKFYVFYGEDTGIRKHYVDKINTFFDEKLIADNWKSVKSTVSLNRLFKSRQLILIFNDEDFLHLKEAEYTKFLAEINTDYTCIFIYDLDKLDKTELFKYCSDYITEFQAVQLNIAKEFIEDELEHISKEDEEELAYNCGNLYSNILLEADKIKQYEDYMQTSQENAYEALRTKDQLIFRPQEFSSWQFMDDVLQVNHNNLAYWYSMLQEFDNGDKLFVALTSIFNDFLIAGLCKKYGKYDGGSMAYNNFKLPWGRIKVIREYDLPFESDHYFVCAYDIAGIDYLIKSGKLDKAKILDYIMTRVV